MKRLILIAVFIMARLATSAQNIAPRDNFLWDANYFNPAVTARETGIYADIYGRYDMNEVKKMSVNPLDIVAKVNIIRGDHSWTTSLTHDGFSFLDVTQFDMAYSHGFIFGKNKEHHLSAGGRLILGFGRIDFSKLDYGQYGYRVFTNPDLDLGLEYNFKYFHTGISVKNVLSLKMKDEGITYFRYPRSLVWHMLFDINLIEWFSLYPYMAIGVNPNVFVELGTELKFSRYIDVGYSFHSPQFSHNFYLDGVICRRVKVGAGYSFSATAPTSAVCVRLSVRLAE